MKKLTVLEMKVMTTITKDEFYEEGYESCIWTENFLDNLNSIEDIDPKQARGTLSSLVKKKMIYMDSETIQFEEAGVEWMKENLKDLDEEGYRM